VFNCALRACRFLWRVVVKRLVVVVVVVVVHEKVKYCSGQCCHAVIGLRFS